MAGILGQTGSLLLLIFGFGFVIFWHELGHFIAAKWAKVRVEQFAVGFGQAMFSWRKGLGLNWGSSAKKVESLVVKERERLESTVQPIGEHQASHESDDEIRHRLGISETEYRLNWIPLGGYVKMLGQDDLNPNAIANDPHAYNMKPISKRMVIVSAGVIMNVILAAIGFFVLFLIGFDVPPPVVGAVAPNSPAQRAGIRVGDRILSFDGKVQRDFTKIQLSVALVKEGEAVPVVVHHAGDPEGKTDTLTITAGHADLDTTGFLQLGIAPSSQLEGMTSSPEVSKEIAEDKDLTMPDVYAVPPGEKIVAINGQPIDPNDKQQLQSFWRLDKAAQETNGQPFPISLSSGKTVQVSPRFVPPFSGALNFAGLEPRAMIDSITTSSSANGKLKPGDVVESVTVGTDTKLHPSFDELMKIFRSAGDKDAKVNLVVIRGGQPVTVNDLTTMKISKDRRGLGVQLDCDADSPVIGAILPKSTADEAKISVTDSSDVSVTKLGDEPVKDFHDIRQIIAAAKPGNMPVTLKSDAGEKTATLALTNDDIQGARNAIYGVDLALHTLSQPRQTKNFVQAAQWGGEETRDLIVQFYITLQRMFAGSVPVGNMMGPYGIVKAGATFASKGNDYLIWFLAMISANLAVVNFLPIPIVDGGLFTFLIIEKIQGKPLSPKVHSIAQLVGIVLIASVFIFVTYQDIMRR